jgi:hypothetical protein
MRFAHIVAALLLGVLATPPVAYSQKIVTSVAWQEFRPEGGGFRVEMPGRPELTSQKRQITTIHHAEVKRGNTEFVISYNEFSAEDISRIAADRIAIDKMFDTARDSNLQNFKAKLRDEQRETVKGHPARRWIFDVGAQTAAMRSILAGNRFINLVAIGSTGFDADPLAKRFLESFTLTPP